MPIPARSLLGSSFCILRLASTRLFAMCYSSLLLLALVWGPVNVISEEGFCSAKPSSNEGDCRDGVNDLDSGDGNDWKSATSVYDFTVNDISGNPVKLDKYKGHVLLIVNVASKCGLTSSNYKQLQELQVQYGESKGLRILAFPCNQFGSQEPGTSEDIVCFATKNNATFDFFEKINVNGDDASPLWKYLKKEQGGTLGDAIKWNFTKFIVNKEGKVVERHGPTTEPKKLAEKLEKYF